MFQLWIDRYTKPDDVVMDLCSGSGVLSYCAMKKGRNVIAVDSSDDAVLRTKRAVSTVIREKYGEKLTGHHGFQRMESTLTDMISEDPILSKRLQGLLNRLAEA